MLRENVIERNADRPLGLCKAAAFCIRTVGHQREHAFLADLRKALKIDGVTEHRCVIHLKVACVDNHACRRIDRQCGRILDTVVRLDKLDPELAQINGLSVLHHLASCGPQQIVFF